MKSIIQSFSQLFLPKWQFSIFNIGGALGMSRDKAKSKSKTTESGSRTTTGDKQVTAFTSATQQQQTTADEATTQRQRSEDVVSLLDEETQGFLRDMLQTLGGGDDFTSINQALTERALGADADLAGITDPIVTNARSRLEERLGQTMQQLSRTAGSSQNSLVAQLGLDEAAQVEREVADLAATLGLQTRQLATSELEGAQTRVGGLAVQLADVLKGATQIGTTTQTSNIQRQLSELLAGSSTEQSVITELEKILESFQRTSRAKERATANNTSASVSGGFGFGG